METIRGYVDHIIYRNTENGYTVLVLICEEEELTCVGIFSDIVEGENIEAKGEFIEHPVYGHQFKVSSFEEKAPEDEVAIERYLGSGAIKGIGPAIAGRIIKKFKLDTFRIIEEEPERLSEVKGISEKKAREIAIQFEEKKETRNAMMFLQQYGISNRFALKIYDCYGPEIYQILKENPYRLAEDIAGIGFKLADEIASKAGVEKNSDFRIQAGIIYTLGQASQAGHIYVPWELLLQKASELLILEKEDLEKHMIDLSLDKRIVVKETEEGKIVYPSILYYMEMNSARMMLDLNFNSAIDLSLLKKKIDYIEI